ncbi:MAG: 3'-5' exonuclease [Rhodospirillales bacterium]|jgi:DNA polymerase-3 subunit epsilon|nr:3'-5' exonuclease [Rhodospirillales bacterium]
MKAVAAGSGSAGASESFLAVDFETATYAPESACAIGLAFVENGRVVQAESRLIRPASREFRFTWVHGITWADVEHSPDFAELWPALRPWFDRADFVAAHNARFDRRVLDVCCMAYGFVTPRVSWVCTVELARTLWRLKPAKLPDVCRHLAIPLNHHQAGSDARACAEIVIAAEQDGWSF